MRGIKFPKFARKGLSAMFSPSIDKSKQTDSQSNHIGFDPTNAEAYIKEARQLALTTGRPSVELNGGMTFDLLLKMCHGLVTTNREIWERCKPFCCKAFRSVDDSTEKCLFYRVRYVNAETRLKCLTSEGIRCYDLKSEPHIVKLVFEIPISLPAELDYLISTPRPDQDDFMPDYGLLLQRSMLLIDEFIPTFLLEFKVFLENQQLALGRADVWLFHENEPQLFLNEHFGLTVDYNNATWLRLSPTVASCKKCSRCRDTWYNHEKTVEDWVTCKTDGRPGCFPLRDETKVEKLLRFTLEGNIEFNASIETPDEQNRLLQFLKFVGHSKTSPAQS